MNIFHCNNTGMIHSKYGSGGLIGAVSKWHFPVFDITFIDSHNTGSVKGENSGVGGFVGQITTEINTTMINCSNTGDIYTVEGAGGFFGWIQNGTGSLTVKNSNNTGSVLCHDTCGGIIGNKSMTTVPDSIVFESIASIGTVTAENGMACGFACLTTRAVIPKLDITFFNSICKGKVSGVKAYGLFNRIERVGVGLGNIVINYVGVLAEINGTSKAYTFTDYQIASLSSAYTMKSLCKNCAEDVTIIKKTDGQYYFENNTLAIRTLNIVAVKRGWEMVWTENLELTPMLWISFGSPLNDVITIGPGVPLDALMSVKQKEKASGYFLAKNVSNALIRPEFDTFKESTEIILCYSMTVKYVEKEDGILYMENNKPLVNNSLFAIVVALANLGIVDYYDSSVVYELDYVMTKNLTVVIVNKHKVEFGLPVNKTVNLYPGSKLSDAIEMAQFSPDDYVLVNKSSGQELNIDIVVDSNIIVKVFCKVVAEGAYEGSWVVSAGSTLGNISGLKPYFGKDYVVVDTAEMLVVDQGTVVSKNMRLHVSESSQEASVKIGSPVDRTVHVSVGTRLGEISALKPFFDSGYSVVNGKNSTVVYNKDTVVSGDMVLSIVKKWVMVIEITPTDASLVDESEVERMVKNLAGGADVSVESKVEDGKVTQLEVTVDSREIADMVVSYLNELDKGEGCQAGILCKVDHAYVAGEGGLSQGSWYTVSVAALVAALLFVLF